MARSFSSALRVFFARRLLLLFFIAPLAAADPVDSGDGIPGPITTIAAIKKLSVAQVVKGPAVRIEGVVTYYDPGSYLFFVQDETAGIYIDGRNEDQGFRAGDLIRVEGIAGKGALSNKIIEPSFRLIGRKELPTPKQLSPEQITNPATDCDRVQVKGILRSVAEERGRLVYYIGVGTERIKVTITTLAREEGARMIGRTLSVTGVHAALFNKTRDHYSMRLLCHSLRDIAVEESNPGVALFDQPVVHVADLQAAQAGSVAHIQIITDEYRQGQMATGHDSSGTIALNTTQQLPVSNGAVLDIVGYVARTNGVVSLDDAFFQRIGFENKRTFSPEDHDFALRLIQTAAEVRRLSPAEAAREYPVRLRGVITYYDSQWGLCFLQGATEGIFIFAGNQPLDIAAGELAVVSGYTSAGDYAPILAKPKFDVLEKAPMPAAKRVAFNELVTGVFDSQWVKMRCTVRNLTDDGQRIDLEVTPSDSPRVISHVTILKSTARDLPSGLLGGQIEVEAVCATDFDSARHLKGVHFFCPGFRFIRVLEASPADAFALSVSPIDAAFQFRPHLGGDERLHVSGVVTWADGRGSFFLEDTTGGLRVFSEGSQPAIGERLHVVGMRNVKEQYAALDHALVRSKGMAAAFTPMPINASRAVKDATAIEGRLVQLEGSVLESRRTADGLEILLEQDNTPFSATMPLSSNQVFHLEPASIIQVTGVAVFAKDANFQARGLQLFLRGPADVSVIKTPRLWTLRRLGAALGTVIVVTLLALLWIAVLRRRIATHKAVLESNLERQRALETQVVQSQKMESIGNLAGGVAHDFNNLLTVILGYASALRDAQLSGDHADALQEINSAAKRAADLTRQLLLFSRREAPKPAVIELNETLRGVTRMIQRLLGEDVTLQFKESADAAWVNADRGMIEQVVMNLAVNARDAMADGGFVTISLARRMSDGANLPQAQGRRGAFICVSVRDTGTGIPPENLSKIFEPFFTTKDVGKGTGLGLATVYGIVKQHQGWIDVQSAVGVGTTFFIYLPAVEKPEPGAEPRDEYSKIASTHASILLVEDDASVRQMASAILKRAGYSVVEAASGPAAEERYARNPQIDILVSDCIMPGGMSGGELARRLRERDANLPVLLTSGYADFRGRALQPPHGAKFLKKPYSDEALLRSVNDLLSAKLPATIHNGTAIDTRNLQNSVSSEPAALKLT